MREGLQKILICGYGSMGRKYHELIKKNWKNVGIILVTSQNLEKKELGKNIEVERDLKSAINKNCTHAIIANPATEHVEYAIKVLENGINALIEKPLFTDEGENQEEILGKIKNKEKAFVGYVLRQDKIIKKIKNIIDSGKLGELIAIDAKCGSWLPDWRPNRNYKETVSAKKSQGGGVLLELSHEIDLVLYLAGSINVEYGWTKNTGILGIETDDIASIAGVTKKDVRVNIGIDFCSKPAKRFGEIKLSKGSISYDLIHRKVIVTEYSKGSSDVYEMPQNAKDRLMKQIHYLLDNESYQSQDFCSIEEAIEVVNVIKKVKGK